MSLVFGAEITHQAPIGEYEAIWIQGSWSLFVPRSKPLQSFRKVQKVGNLSRVNISISAEVRCGISQLETSPAPEGFPGLGLGLQSAEDINQPYHVKSLRSGYRRGPTSRSSWLHEFFRSCKYWRENIERR